MSTQCQNFADLEASLKNLKEIFLDDQLALETSDPIGFLPEIEKIAAFKILFHAEIENFLESKATENIATLEQNRSRTDWSKFESTFIQILLILKNLKIENQNFFAEKHYNSLFNDVIKNAKKTIVDNNGIKENSFVVLSVLSGKFLHEIDTTLKSLLNSYGTSRGEIAHKRLKRIQSINTPSSELQEAQNIKDQLKIYFNLV